MSVCVEGVVVVGALGAEPGRGRAEAGVANVEREVFFLPRFKRRCCSEKDPRESMAS